MNKIIQGDCIEELKKLEENSVDAIITDPPYGLEFMGKEWDAFDKNKGSWDKRGNEGKTKDSYGRLQGTAPIKYQAGLPMQLFFEQWATECLRVLKPGGFLLAFGGTRTYHRLTCGIEDAGFEIRDTIMWLYGSGFPKSLNIGKQIDKMEGIEHPKNIPISENNSMSGANYTRNKMDVQSELGKQWEGWGTALKPACEPIVVARKPLSEKNVALNVLKWGTGGINIDACRINYQSEKDKESAKTGNYVNQYNLYKTKSFNASSTQNKLGKVLSSEQGRFPANIILNRSYEQVYILKERFINLIPLLNSYYGNEYMFKLWKEVSNLQEQNKGQSWKVLQQEMLSSMDERKEKSDAGEEAQQEINPENEKEPQEYSKGKEQQEIHGVLDEQRIQISQQGRINSTTEDIGKPNDKEVWDSRTQNSNGNSSKQTIKEMGDSSSQEWNKERQQNREFGDDGQLNTQERTQGDIKRIKAITKGKRGFIVYDCDLPEEWRDFFEPTIIEIDYPFSSAKMLDEQSGESKSIKSKRGGNVNSGEERYQWNKGDKEKFNKDNSYECGFQDKGGASRFFYCAKASKSERNFGLEEFEDKQKIYRATANGTGEVSKNMERFASVMKNNHPTVKPIKLMEYLIKLVTKENAVVLDPFLGSGTTAIACLKLNRKFIGIEKEEEYVKIAEARIKPFLEQEKL